LSITSPISQTQIENFFAGIDQDGKEVEEYTKFKNFICESEEISGEFRRLKADLESKQKPKRIPVAQGRPRFSNHGGFTRVYDPSKIRYAKQHIRYAAGEASIPNKTKIRKLLVNNSEEGFSWKDTLAHGVLSILYSGSANNSVAKDKDEQYRKIQSHDYVNSLRKRFSYLDDKLQILNSLEKKDSRDKKLLTCSTSIIDMMVQSKIISKRSLKMQEYTYDPNFYWLSDKVFAKISEYKLFGIIPLSEIISPKKSPLISMPREFIVNSDKTTNGCHPHPMFDESVSDFMLTAIPLPIDSQLIFTNKSRITFGKNSIALQSINKIQSMEWQYNSDLLDVLENIKFDEESLNENINEDNSPPEIQDKTPGNNGNYGTYAILAFKHRDMLRKLNCQTLFLKWFFDYRGRIYSSKQFLNPQGRDIERAMLLTCDDRPVNQSVEKIYRYIGNLFKVGDNKELIDQVFEETRKYLQKKPVVSEEVLDEILRGALVSLGCKSTDAILRKRKFQFLAFILEHYYLQNQNLWRIPILLDATCNGQQHHAAMTKNRDLAVLTRLIPQKNKIESDDLYTKVAKDVKNSLSKPKKLKSKIPALQKPCPICKKLYKVKKNGELPIHRKCKDNKKALSSGERICGEIFQSVCSKHNLLCTKIHKGIIDNNLKIVYRDNAYLDEYWIETTGINHHQDCTHACEICIAENKEATIIIRDFLLDNLHEIRRETVKKPVMTYGYGATNSSIKYLFIQNEDFLPRDKLTNKWDEIINKLHINSVFIQPKVDEGDRYVFLESLHHYIQFTSFHKLKNGIHVRPVSKGYYLLKGFDSWRCSNEGCSSTNYIESDDKIQCQSKDCNVEMEIFDHKQSVSHSEERSYQIAREKVCNEITTILIEVCKDIMPNVVTKNLKNIIREIWSSDAEKAADSLEKERQRINGLPWSSNAKKVANALEKERQRIKCDLSKEAYINDESWPAFSVKNSGFTTSFVKVVGEVAPIEKADPFVGKGVFDIPGIKLTSVTLRGMKEQILDVGKTESSFSPNFTHMLDATHLHMIVNEFFKENPDAKTFLPVHDEFGVHPNDVESLQKCVVKTFRELHKSEPLKQFWLSVGLKKDDYPIDSESFLDEEEFGKSMVSF